MRLFTLPPARMLGYVNRYCNAFTCAGASAVQSPRPAPAAAARPYTLVATMLQLLAQPPAFRPRAPSSAHIVGALHPWPCGGHGPAETRPAHLPTAHAYAPSARPQARPWASSSPGGPINPRESCSWRVCLAGLVDGAQNETTEKPADYRRTCTVSRTRPQSLGSRTAPSVAKIHM